MTLRQMPGHGRTRLSAHAAPAGLWDVFKVSDVSRSRASQVSPRWQPRHPEPRSCPRGLGPCRSEARSCAACRAGAVVWAISWSAQPKRAWETPCRTPELCRCPVSRWWDFFTLRLLPAGTERALKPCDGTRVLQPQEVSEEGRQGGRAVCHCFLTNAGFDMIIKSDFCVNFFANCLQKCLG